MTDLLESPVSSSGMLTLGDDFTNNLFVTDRGDAPSVAPTCEYPGCENETVKTNGRGPYPKYCPEHKNSKDRTRGTIPTAPRTKGARKWKAGVQVEENLGKIFTFAALPAAALPNGSVFQKDALLVTYYGPQIIHELVVLADDDIKLQTVLLRLSTPGKYGPLIAVIAAMLLGIAANHGLLPPMVSMLVENSNAKAFGGES